MSQSRHRPGSVQLGMALLLACPALSLTMGGACAADFAAASAARAFLHPASAVPAQAAAARNTDSASLQRAAPGSGGADSRLTPGPAAGRAAGGLNKPDLLAQRAILPPRGEVPGPSGTPNARLSGGGKRKNPALAGLLSAIVPGAGQAYLGSQSAYGYLGVEVAAWTAHFATKSTGNAKEKEYKRYADSHWSFERYRDPNSADCTVDGHSDNGVQDSTLVMLYETRRNDWYEDIGKLSIYSCGWDSPANRLKYRDMRRDSNTFLSHARTATSVILLNHLVSALMAARGAAKHNLKLTGGLELDWKVTPSLAQTSGSVTLRQRF